MSTFKNKNSLRTIEDQIVQKLKNNGARPKFTGSYKKKVGNTTRSDVEDHEECGEKTKRSRVAPCFSSYSDWVCTAVMSNDVMKDLRG